MTDKPRLVLTLDVDQAAALGIALAGAKLFNEGIKPVSQDDVYTLRMDRVLAAKISVLGQTIASAVGKDFNDFTNNQVPTTTDLLIDTVIEWLRTIP